MRETFSLKYKIDTLLLLTLIVEIIFIVVCFCILGVRATSVMRDSLYFPSSGGEAPSLYGIYKVWSGESLYHSPSKNPTIFSYNFLFYYIYGLIAKLFVTKAENLAVFTNFFTLVIEFCFLIVILSYLYHEMKNFVKGQNDTLMRVIILLIPVAGYLGPFVGWWNLTARPDIMAVGLEMTALIFFIFWLRNYKNKSIIPITLIFWLAWSMKQTAIFIWLGILLVLSIQHRWKQVVISITIFLLFSLIPLFLFGWPYIEHAIIMPLLIHSSLRQCIEVVKEEGLLVGSHVYIPALILMIYHLVSRKKHSPVLSILVIVFTVAIIGNFITSSTIASSRNHYFSSFFVAQLFIAQYLISNWHDQAMAIMGRRLFLKVLLSGFSLGLFMSSLYLVFPNKLGRITLPVEPAPPYKREEAERVRQIIYSASKPVFVEWAFYALPWHSGQNPSEVIEWEDYFWVQRKGFLASLEKRVKDKYYAEAFVIEERWARLFEDSGYKKLYTIGRMIRFVR